MTFPTFPTFPYYDHDPADVLDYPFDWQGPQPFLKTGVEILTSTFAVRDTQWALSTALTVVSSDHDDTTTQVRIAVATAVPGSVYYITNHVVATDGQEKDQTIEIRIKEQ